MYKTLLKPLWTYGLNRMQTFQNITLGKLTNAPYFVSNHMLHQDLKIKSINEETKCFYKIFHNRLVSHINPLIKNLASNSIPGYLPV